MPMRIRFFALAALAAVAAACPRPQSTPPVVRAAPGQEFALSPGQRAAVDGDSFSVAFLRVVEDSRCPQDVQCIHAGNARVELEMRLAPDRAENAVLGTTAEPRWGALGPYRVHLVRLDPLPTQAGPPRRYTATLRVDRG